MSTIQNFATIVHLHWLRDRYPHASLDELVTQTHSVRYAQLALMQAGYRRNGLARYIAGSEHQETDVGLPMDHFDAVRRRGLPRMTPHWPGTGLPGQQSCGGISTLSLTCYRSSRGERCTSPWYLSRRGSPGCPPRWDRNNTRGSLRTCSAIPGQPSPSSLTASAQRRAGIVLLVPAGDLQRSLAACGPELAKNLPSRLVLFDVSRQPLLETLERYRVAGAVDSLSLAQWLAQPSPGAVGPYGLRQLAREVGATCVPLAPYGSRHYCLYESDRHQGLPHLLADYLRATSASVPRRYRCRTRRWRCSAKPVLP